MPIRGRNSDVIRIVRRREGKVRMCMDRLLRFEYGPSGSLAGEDRRRRHELRAPARIENLTLIGRHDDARRLFERLLTLANDVGLLSEEYGFRDKRLLGNFPQAFSHIALVNAALRLSAAEAGKAQARFPGSS